MGGPDSEFDVSIQSGNAVVQALQQCGTYDVRAITIDIPTIQEIAAITEDVIFPVLHGPFGEGGPLQLLLEQTAKKFVGSSSEVATVAMNKESTKEIATKIGLRTPDWCILEKDSASSIQPPVVLKPIDDGSSIGISICTTKADFDMQRNQLQKKHKCLLAETYINGRELTVGIIHGEALPIIEIIPPTDLLSYNYEAKYDRNDTEYIIEPVLPANTCVGDALSLYASMHIRDIARVDFILDDTATWLLEINTMPGFTSHSLLPMAAKHAGIDMPTLCGSLVDSAYSR